MPGLLERRFELAFRQAVCDLPEHFFETEKLFEFPLDV
jgi:hypothetical protein